MREKRDVIKSSAAIHIQNNITLLQRRAWNVLLANAYDELPDEEEHRIRVKDLMEILEFDSKNEYYIKESLKALTTCAMEWNVLEKDGEHEWGVTTLLAQAKIRRGVCTYAYSPELRRRLYNPRMYARISLTMQNKFDSKHAQALWELCVDYLDESRNAGETPFIPLSIYRKMMGLSDDMYPEFKKLNKWVIKDPVDEINRVTDFRVTPETRRESRKVSAVKFKARRMLALPGQDNRTLPLFADLEDMPQVVRELKEAGLSASEAWKIFQEGAQCVKTEPRPAPEAFEEYIREKIHLLKRRQASGKIDSATGFLLQAIRRNYANPEYAEEARRADAQRKRNSARAREREMEKLQEKKTLIEKARRVDAHRVCGEVIAAMPESLEQAVNALREKDKTFEKLYNQVISPLENYRHTFFLQVLIDNELERQQPEHFSQACGSYDADLAAIDTQLDKLRQAAE